MLNGRLLLRSSVFVCSYVPEGFVSKCAEAVFFLKLKRTTLFFSMICERFASFSFKETVLPHLSVTGDVILFFVC